jgi:trafficking protein particle complex subunit 9
MMDRFSPVAPATIRVHVLPVGTIRPGAFRAVLDDLQAQCHILRLEHVDVGNDQQILLSPKTNPRGSLFLNYTTFGASEQEQQLSPFELFREPLIVLGVADGFSENEEERKRELKHAAEYLRDRHPRVVHRHLLLLQEAQDGSETLGPNVTTLRKQTQQDEKDEGNSPLHRATCHVAARFLVEFSTYAQAMQATPTVQTPRQARLPIRTVSLRDPPQPAAGSGTETPTHEVTSPPGEETSRPPSRGVGSPPPRGPASSFEQVQRTAVARSDSNASSRSRNGKRGSSQDRGSVHNFGPELSKSKAKDRGRARVGIVIAHIHLMAGQWSEAIRMLVEHTNVVRKLNDHHWHAKGLEGIVVCMLLLAWARVEFSIPSICYPAADRNPHSHVQKLSVNLPSDFRPTDAAHQASVRRLSTSLPDLLLQILGLYASSEGPLELPFLVVAEVKIRSCDLMTILLKSKGELSGDTLRAIVQRTPGPLAAKLAIAVPGSNINKGVVASLIAEAQPQEDEEVALPDHVQILTGVYGVYSSLGMDRKKGLVLKDLVAKLTVALTQARKLGAAEAGIHPAASLPLEPPTDPTLAMANDRAGVNALVDMIAKVFGIDLIPYDSDREKPSSEAKAISLWRPLESDTLNMEIMRLLIAFYDASLDPYGILRLESSFLRLCAPCAALDMTYGMSGSSVPKEEQEMHASNLTRAAQLYTIQGYPDVVAEYWDPFLLRGVVFDDPDPAHALHPRSPIGSNTTAGGSQVPGNPLLYDPNASRPGTAALTRQLMVCNEPQKCTLKLQNPLDISVDVESIVLVTDGKEQPQLESKDFKTLTLGPRRFQQVSFSISPTALGDFSITGAQIKVANCRERFFPIFSCPLAPSPQLLAKGRSGSAPATSGVAPKGSVVLAHAVPSMPLLKVEHISLGQQSLMLLDGEHQVLDVIVRNAGLSGPAAIFEVVEGQGVLRLALGDAAPAQAEDGALVVVQAGECVKMSFDVSGKAGVSKTQLDLYYCLWPPNEDDRYARVLSIPFAVTVDAALQVHHPQVADVDEKAFTLSFDLQNRWPKPLYYRCETLEDASGVDDGVLAPGEMTRVSISISRWSCQSRNVEEVFEELRRRLGVFWRSWDGNRFGKVDLRALALSPAQLEIIRGSLCRMHLQLVKPGAGVRVGDFFVLRVRLVNDMDSDSGSLVLELRLPSGERRLASIGVLRRLLPPISAKSECEVDFAFCPLMAGSCGVSAVANSVSSTGSAGLWHTEALLTVRVGEKSPSR